MNPEKEVTKEEFKELYFKYGVGNGWTADYWDKFYEKQEGVKYLFREPSSDKENRMFIAGDSKEQRMFLLTEDVEEQFFDHQELPNNE